ncbi:16S rRNA (guanine(966)-N(2))-methyltransferase RsmD [Peptostreptococcus equinus]|uniref:16S rRNA (Guanine(966)-N(2))-methyltransferase RsmD n=1 Tax=Peptostreptococcus equinus TaxID=3003601 RepID=A0ABY7JLJ6_9FIRM|nr:16S rRNA (guanine(966)-N(2))-methyltransferase RsmD [Peptostreptococcus sp. CBA3647]WAW14218.1 16S rRNA (guanine(966)-N(2))-methyltransferase RsmD [Peptostreptococcus sp. CBA3647]
MRVISGSARGLKLSAPANDKVRPTTDRVKESMFNIISFDICDSVVLDLFSGSGSLGIECISRGARKAYFCDKDKESIKLIKENIKKSRFENKSEMFECDYKLALSKLQAKGEKIDIIFVDPPYYEGLFEEVLKNIEVANIIKDSTIVVVEHDAKTEIVDGTLLKKNKEKKYGLTKLTFYSVGE